MIRTDLSFWLTLRCWLVKMIGVPLIFLAMWGAILGVAYGGVYLLDHYLAAKYIGGGLLIASVIAMMIWLIREVIEGAQQIWWQCSREVGWYLRDKEMRSKSNE